MWPLTEFLYDLFPFFFYGGLVFAIAFFIVLKKRKIVIACIIVLLFSFVYIARYPTRYPFADDWIIGKTREEILKQYGNQHLLRNEEDMITYRCHGDYSYAGRNWWTHLKQGVDLDYEYTIFFDASGKAIGIEYRGYG